VSPFVLAWARAFAVTLAVELAVATPLLRDTRGRRLAVVALANLASHPAVWFVFPELGLGWPAWLVAAELWALAVEAVAMRALLSGVGARRAALVALAANAASFAVGMALRAAGMV
jgi:hypothetical protein